MRSLPLFHRIAGQKVIVLGEGPLAEPKRRLVERAGGEVVTDREEGIAVGARLAFVAHEDQERCEMDAMDLRRAGILVNVVDRPEMCDFTTPSILDRDPVLVAFGTSGASAGLAKHLRLRFEALLPENIGELAQALHAAKARLRARWPDAGLRRRALDEALGQGGALDPFDERSVGNVEDWLDGARDPGDAAEITLAIASDDPDDLTLRQARLLGTADAILFDPEISPAILARARADAQRFSLPHQGPRPHGQVLILRRER